MDEKTRRTVRIVAVLWSLVPVFLIGMIVATNAKNPTLTVVFMAAGIVFTVAAILTGGIYGLNRLMEYIIVLSKRG